ncbi:MAG: hypothetical protein LBG84_01695 [Treponema sp.]|jgi:hypothetical protein|nr:hypothetical protein [Treponema sp.]
MKNKIGMAVFTGILLVFAAGEASGDIFSRTFNPEYPIYGFNRIGYQKSPTAAALTRRENFVTAPDTAVILEEAVNAKNGKYKIKLVLRRGLTRTAALDMVLQSDTVTGLNYITRLDFHDFTADPQKNVEIDWNDRESRLDDIIKLFGELMIRFYNPAALTS